MSWSAEGVYLVPSTGEVVIRRPASIESETATTVLIGEEIPVIVVDVAGADYLEERTDELTIGATHVVVTRIIVREV